MWLSSYSSLFLLFQPFQLLRTGVAHNIFKFVSILVFRSDRHFFKARLHLAYTLHELRLILNKQLAPHYLVDFRNTRTVAQTARAEKRRAFNHRVIAQRDRDDVHKLRRVRYNRVMLFGGRRYDVLAASSRTSATLSGLLLFVGVTRNDAFSNSVSVEDL